MTEVDKTLLFLFYNITYRINKKGNYYIPWGKPILLAFVGCGENPLSSVQYETITRENPQI
jgi:hypothetical protein